MNLIKNGSSVMDFLSGHAKCFVIPPFQRNYQWTEEQCEELFQDIVKAHSAKKSHYLGNIVYYYGQNDSSSYRELVLVDGQQRITTILVLLCSIRDSISDEDIKENIRAGYLENISSKVEAYRVRLKQTASDHQNFTKLIMGKTAECDAENNIIKNYYTFRRLIAETKDISAIDLYEEIIKLEVVEVNLQWTATNGLDMVQTVFEKINSTGKLLSAADLIRNLLLLAPNAKKQDELYNNYWIKIEDYLRKDSALISESISAFVRDYLILKTYENVSSQPKEAYRMFKTYFLKLGTSNANENTLIEMARYAKYYGWILNFNCEDKEINRSLIMLSILRSGDLTALCLYLLSTMFQINTKELRSIFALLVDFMIRYRIVAPYGGSNALCNAMLDLLRKASTNEIALTHEAFLFELSNSTSQAARFPDDKEFKERLMQMVSTKYARMLLLRIEEGETRNTNIDPRDVTVEHLMPQTLSPWWQKHLGGKESAENVYETYLNAIGNLTIVSQGYNGSMQNLPWHEKVQSLEKVQFAITTEIPAKFSCWDKASLDSRNDDMSTRACRVITKPIPRTRPIKVIAESEYLPGKYQLSDVSVSVTGASILSVEFDGRVLECLFWKDLIPLVCSQLLVKDAAKFLNIVDENSIHKSVASKKGKHKAPVLSTDKDSLVAPIKIENSNFYCEGGLSADRARHYARELALKFDLADAFTIEIF